MNLVVVIHNHCLTMFAVAEGLVDKGSIKFHNHKMDILKFEEDSAYSSLKKNKEPSLEMMPPKKQQFTSIKISGIQSGMTPSLLKMYFREYKKVWRRSNSIHGGRGEEGDHHIRRVGGLVSFLDI